MQAFLIKPSSTGYSEISTWWKKSRKNNIATRGNPLVNIRTHFDDVTFLHFALRVLEIHAITQKICFCPWLCHDGAFIKATDHYFLRSICEFEFLKKNQGIGVSPGKA